MGYATNAFGLGKFTCRLLNTGSGPAIVREVRLRVHGEDLPKGLPAHLPIAAGEGRDAEVPATWTDSPRTADLVIEYTHSNGKHYATKATVAISDNALTCLTYERAKVVA